MSAKDVVIEALNAKLEDEKRLYNHRINQAGIDFCARDEEAAARKRQAAEVVAQRIHFLECAIREIRMTTITETKPQAEAGA